MDQELQMLISTLYGNKLNEKQLSNIIQMWNSNQNGYLDNMRKQAFAKMPAGTNKINPVAALKVMNQTVGTTPKLGLSSFTFDKSLGRAANDMSAIADFKQAFKAARQGGHKTFFWKKTKANPSGMFSTELASNLPATKVETKQAPVEITAQLDKNKVNALMPKAPTFGPKYDYEFDVNSANAELRNQYRQNPHSNMSMRPYLEQGGNIQRQSSTSLIGNSGASVADVITVINSKDMNAIQELFSSIGQEGFEQVIRSIQQMAEAGDGSAMQALQTLLELMLGSQKAKLGTKLNYIQKLKGICPEGTEKIYLRNGGCMCAQKAKDGTKTKMPTKYDEKRHERLAIGEAMGKNNKAQQDSLQHYRKLYNDMPASDKYKMGDQDPHGKNPKKKVLEKGCGGKTLVNRKKG